MEYNIYYIYSIMSIATLKRKSQVKYNNMSVGSTNGFSLNGTHRSQGYVGQTSLSRSLPRSLMNGNTLRGHGGCSGTYRIMPVVNNEIKTLNDNSVIKSSVSNTEGMIDTKYRWVRRPYPYAVVKPDNTMNLNTQADYINKIKKETIKEADDCNVSTDSSKTCTNYNPYFRTNICNFTKPESDYVPISAGEYTTKLQKSCVDNDVYTIPNNTHKTPFF